MHCLQSTEPTLTLTDNVRIERHVGHTMHDLQVFVEDTIFAGAQHKRVCVAGDIFDSGDDLDAWRQSSAHPQLQYTARQYIKTAVDVIVPGHGDAFMTQ